MADRRPILHTAAGSHSGAFQPSDWSYLTATSLIWGSSFLWIAVGLESLAPGMVGWLRLVLAAGTLALLPKARRHVDRADWPAIAIVAIAGNGGPALLFAFAERTLESSVAGMINASVPLFTLLIAFLLGQRSFRLTHGIGLVIGFAGVVLLSLPNVAGAEAAAGGVALVFLAVIGYALTSNVLVPLQQRYGALPVILRAQVLSAVLVAPFGIAGLGSSRFEIGPVLAVVVLGVAGTGIARTFQATVVGRVGAPRASIIGYLVPVVAIVLGVAFRSETISAIEIGGLALILAGAWFVSRRS